MKKKRNMQNINLAEKTIGLQFKNKDLLVRAFTHRSYLNENNDSSNHNERLEYLGDAVLEFLISKYLYTTYPDSAEGELTSFRSAVVKTDTLAASARELDFGAYLRMSKGEEKTGGREKEYLLANTFEAVLGAMFLDQGMKKVEAFLKKSLFPKVKMIVDQRLDIDPKTRFQELAQDTYRVTPVYEILSEKGPDHNKEFTMGVYLGKTEYGRGTGSSKQRAEEAAARVAVTRIEREKKNRNIKPSSYTPEG